MSEKQKINLKALKSNVPKTEPISTKEVIDNNSALLKEQNDTGKIDTTEPKFNDVPDKTETKTDNAPAKISFASIRKEVEEIAPEVKVEEINAEKKDSIGSEKDINLSSGKSVSHPNTENPLDIAKTQLTATQNSSTDLDKIGEEKNDDVKTVVDTNIAMKEDIIPDQHLQNSEVKQETKIEQTPEEIEAVLASAEGVLVKKKKGLFGFLHRKKSVKQDKKEKKEDEVGFSNYESHFKKESTNFLGKFQKFKYTPKTRTGLLMSLILLMFIIIGGLMVTMPGKHSPNIYKASIMQMLREKDEVTVPLPTPEPTVQDPIEEEIIILPIEEPIEEEIKISKQEESKEKLRQYLLNKY